MCLCVSQVALTEQQLAALAHDHEGGIQDGDQVTAHLHRHGTSSKPVLSSILEEYTSRSIIYRKVLDSQLYWKHDPTGDAFIWSPVKVRVLPSPTQYGKF